MRILLISLTTVACSYLLGNGAVEVYRWSKIADLNSERESGHITQTFELKLLRSVLYELENGDKEKATQYLKQHIEFSNQHLQEQLKDNYLSEHGIKTINKYLNSRPKGFDEL